MALRSRARTRASANSRARRYVARSSWSARSRNETGVVLVKCPCDKLFLIAEPEENIEEILKSKGDSMTRMRAEDMLDVE